MNKNTISTQDFEQYFKRFYRPLCLFSLRYTSSLEDAEDVVQQAFADIWEKNCTGVAIENLKAYLYQAVRNRSLSLLSKPIETETTDLLSDWEDASEEEQIQIAERDARLWEIIDALPPERKKIFLMAKRDGLKYQEIAEELNLSIKTIENQMGKALKALRETAVRIYNFFFGY